MKLSTFYQFKFYAPSVVLSFTKRCFREKICSHLGFERFFLELGVILIKIKGDFDIKKCEFKFEWKGKIR